MQQVLLVDKLREDQNTIYHAYVRGLNGLSLFSMGFKMNCIPFVKLRSNCVTLWKLEKNKYEIIYNWSYNVVLHSLFAISASLLVFYLIYA